MTVPVLLIHRQDEIPTRTATDRLLHHARILRHPQQTRDASDQHQETEIGVIGAEVADLEEEALEGGDGGFRAEAGWVCDDAGEGLEDGGSGWHDVVARLGFVPVAAVLRRRKMLVCRVVMVMDWGNHGEE